MKKFLFLSFICLVFAMFTNTVKAQECCFYLEQMPEQVLSDKEGAQFHLNPIIPGVNNGVAEYYYFRFTNCLDPKAKLSIDWEFLVNGAPWDYPLNATGGNPRNLINVEIEWFLPLINNVEFKGSGPLLSGRGLNAAQDFTTINGLKRAVKTDFPGTVESPVNGFLHGYFNPYNGTPRWYNYIYADFLEWACANDYLRIKITRYSTDDIKVNFKLIERTGGFVFLDHYIGDQQQDYMGGHAAAFLKQVGDFDFGEPIYEIDEVVVCAGEIVEYGIDPQGNPYVFENPNAPDGGYEVTTFVYFYNQELPCPNNIDKIVELTIVWKALPLVEIVTDLESLEFCLPEEGIDVELGLNVEPAEGDYTYFIKKHHTLLNEDNEPVAVFSISEPGQYTIKGYVIDNESGCTSAKETIIIIANEYPNFEIKNFKDRESCLIDDPELNGWVKLKSTDNRTYFFGYEYGNEIVQLEDAANYYKFDNLLEGDYVFFAIDSETGCKSEIEHTVEMIMENPLLATAEITQIQCFGEEAVIIIGATGGTAPYGGTGTFRRVAGTYEFTVTDAMGCVNTIEVIIDEAPELLIANADYLSELLCFGDFTDVVITGVGGTEPYTFIFGDIEQEEVEEGIFEVGAGVHTFIVRDANGCEAEVVATITSPTQLIAYVEPWDEILCFGGTTEVKVTAEGGIEGYSNIGNHWLKAGRHAITVTDANGCTADTDSITITEPPLLTITPSEEEPEVLCYGGTITVTLTVEGGTEPYFYNNEPGNDFEVALSEGTHTLSVTDANGCVAEIVIVVTEPEELIATATEEQFVVCKGDDATIVVSATGGVTPYTYWYGEDEFDGEIELPAGTHTLIVIDDNGCEAEVIITIEEPEFPLTLTAYIEETDSIWCNGGTAIVTVEAEGGEPPYVYYVGEDGDEQTDNTFVLEADGYTFYVKDERGCIVTYEFTVTEPVELTAEVSYSYVTCTGNLALVVISPTGGVEPYTYWYDEEEFDGEIELMPGTYTVTVIDANECEELVEFTVEEQEILEIEAEITTEILCKGDMAIVTVTVTGGAKPYTFICGNIVIEGEEDQETAEFALITGTYTFSVVDNSECEVATEEIEIIEPDAKVAASATITDTIKCFGGTATVSVTATGGTGELDGIGTFEVLAGTHTFYVTDENGCIDSAILTITEPRILEITPPISITEPILCFGGLARVHVMAEGGTGLIDSTGHFSRPAGKHIFTVSDENGCTATDSIIITQPNQLLLEAEVTLAIDCFEGTGTVTITIEGGVAPYYYGGDEIEGDEIDIEEVEAGIHQFTITDDNGCFVTIEVEVEQPDELVLTATIEIGHEVQCAGGLATITLSAVGGTGEYIFYYDGSPLTGNTIQLIASDDPYEFTVIDDKECTATITIMVDDPEALTVYIAGDANICIETTTTLTAVADGGTGNYTYLWSTGATTAAISGVLPGNYSVTVTDENECTATNSFVVSFYEDVTVEITAEKGCDDPEIMITVTCSENATITIQGFDVEDPSVVILTETVMVTADNPETISIIYSGGIADFIYFIAIANVDGIPCEFVSEDSEEINYNNMPRLYAYAEPCGLSPAPACLEDNYKEVFLEAPVNHYFRVIDYCKTEKDLHLSVQYTYKYQAPGEDEFIEIGTTEITNYLFTANASFMRYTTPMPGCGSDISYSYVSGNAYFPHPGVVGGGWIWQNNQYNFFTLVFFDNREITVQLPGFSVPGTYHIEYELVTHYRVGTKIPYGNKIDSRCTNRIVGGQGFYTLTPGYDAVVLATRTMIIEVKDEKAPVILDIPTGKVAAATIYPNPATDNINIKVENIQGSTQVRITNMNGQIVLDQQINIANDVASVQLPDLKPGIYFVNIISKDAVLTRKLTVVPKF